MEKIAESDGPEKILKNTGHTRYFIVFCLKYFIFYSIIDCCLERP